MSYVIDSIPAQRNIIALGNPREVMWWRKQFGCSEDQLRHAVSEVGSAAAHVEQYLDGVELLTV